MKRWRLLLALAGLGLSLGLARANDPPLGVPGQILYPHTQIAPPPVTAIAAGADAGPGVCAAAGTWPSSGFTSAPEWTPGCAGRHYAVAIAANGQAAPGGINHTRLSKQVVGDTNNS